MSNIKKQSDKRQWLIGTWVMPNNISSVVYNISMQGSRIKIQAFDMDDDERLFVSKVKWHGNSLQFQTYVKSNGFRAKHTITALSRSRVKQEITSIEYWIRQSNSNED